MRSDVLNDNSAKYLDDIVVNPNHQELHGADDTLDAVADNGTVHIANSADITFTLPAVAADIEYTIVLGVDLAAAEYMRVAPNSSDKFIFEKKAKMIPEHNLPSIEGRKLASKKS